MKNPIAALKKEYKLRLIELMIIVGGLLSAFKISGSNIIYYILFLLFAMVYFVGLSGDVFKHKKITYHALAILVSLCFSIFIGEILGYSLLVLHNFIFILIIAAIYGGVLFLLFYYALTNE